MKTIISIVLLGLGLIIPVLSVEREVFNAGKKQELLSSAAAYALEAEDIQLLNALKKAGWDTSKNLGQMPDQDVCLKFTALTFSTLIGAEGSVRWLLESCGLSPDSRDGNLRRPIDVLIERQISNDALSITKDDFEVFLQLLQRKNQAEESGALEELTCSVIGKFGQAQYSIKSINNAPPPDEWQQFEKTLETTKALADPATDERRPVVKLQVKWDKVAVDEYRFSVSSGNDGWGGGVGGVIYHKHGYWLTKDTKYWDG